MSIAYVMISLLTRLRPRGN